MSVVMEKEKLSPQAEDEAYVARLREAIVEADRQFECGECVWGVDNVLRRMDERHKVACNA